MSVFILKCLRIEVHSVLMSMQRIILTVSDMHNMLQACNKIVFINH